MRGYHHDGVWNQPPRSIGDVHNEWARASRAAKVDPSLQSKADVLKAEYDGLLKARRDIEADRIVSNLPGLGLDDESVIVQGSSIMLSRLAVTAHTLTPSSETLDFTNADGKVLGTACYDIRYTCTGFSKMLAWSIASNGGKEFDPSVWTPMVDVIDSVLKDLVRKAPICHAPRCEDGWITETIGMMALDPTANPSKEPRSWRCGGCNNDKLERYFFDVYMQALSCLEKGFRLSNCEWYTSVATPFWKKLTSELHGVEHKGFTFLC